MRWAGAQRPSAGPHPSPSQVPLWQSEASEHGAPSGRGASSVRGVSSRCGVPSVRGVSSGRAASWVGDGSFAANAGEGSSCAFAGVCGFAPLDVCGDGGASAWAPAEGEPASVGSRAGHPRLNIPPTTMRVRRPWNRGRRRSIDGKSTPPSRPSCASTVAHVVKARQHGVARGAMLIVGSGIYLANVLLGLAAQFLGVHAGRWHHALYAVVFVSTCATAIVDFRPPLLLTLGALALFPKARPRTVLHPLLAGVGAVGYVLCWWPDLG